MIQILRWFLIALMLLTLSSCIDEKFDDIGKGATTPPASQDTTAPVITLNGTNPQNVERGTIYTEQGATTNDGTTVDVNSSAVNVNVVGTYTVTYNATDASGNVASQVTRMVEVIMVDTTPPVITMNGGDITIEAGTTYADAGAEASDDVDGNVTANIVTTNPVDSNVADSYTVTYDVNDSAGNSVQATRSVTVKDTTAPIFTSNSSVDVVENQTSAITLVATDLTATVYSISAGDSSSFDVNSSTGVVTFKVAPDFETKNTYSFTATARDFAGNEVTQNVTINILDVSEVGIKKTGQTKSYDENGTEVTDGSLKDDGFYQKGVTPSYTRDDATNIVTDHTTGLMWQDDVDAGTVTKNWADAKAYCAAKGGGWRLPSRKELVSLSDYGRNYPAIDPTFTNVAPSYYWSSTTYAGVSGSAWLINFGNGNQYSNDKTLSNYVRCVRAGQ